MATSKNPTSNITPAAGYVLIQPQAEEKQTASGIVIPDTVSGDKPQMGQVLSVGDDMLHESGSKLSCPAKKGDTVIYKKWGGNEYKPAGSNIEYMFVKFDDILATVKSK